MISDIANSSSQIPSIEIERIDPLAGNAWDALITGRDDHSVFHRSSWARVLVETYGHRPAYLRMTANGREAALVPLMEVRSPLTGCRGVSLPFSDFAGPLWTVPGAAAEVLDTLDKFARAQGWRYLEIRGGMPPHGPPATFQAYESHQLDLRPGLDSIESGLEPSVRRAIRKAEAGNLSVTVETGDDALKVYYQLHARTRRRHGLPPQPVSFFHSIGQHLMTPGLGLTVIARSGAVPVAGAIFLHSGGRAIYKYGASDPRYWPLRPNQAVMWAGIRHLVESGCHGLHFGRTSKGDEGLARFKLSWGCVSETLRYHRHSSGTGTWLSVAPPRSESHPLVFGHLPLSLNRFAGRLIYPHLD